MKSYSTTNIEKAQAEHHKQPSAKTAAKVKDALKEFQDFITKGTTEHKEIVKGSIVGQKRMIRTEQYPAGGFYEIGGSKTDGKFVRATGETREEAVQNWNAKKWH